jgi:hypothetical protein
VRYPKYNNESWQYWDIQQAEIDDLAESHAYDAKRGGCRLCGSWPCYVVRLIDNLRDRDEQIRRYQKALEIHG